MVQYSTISGISNESVRNNIITNFRHAWGLNKAGLTTVVRKLIMNGDVTNRKEREDKRSSVFACEKSRKTEFMAYKELKKSYEIGEIVWENLPLQTSNLSDTNWMIQQKKCLSSKRMKIC